MLRKNVSRAMLVLLVLSITSASFRIQTANASGLYGTPETAPNGRSFGVDARIGIGGAVESGGYAMIVSDSADGLYVAWSAWEGSNYLPVVYFACSHDDGKSWNTPMKLAGGGSIAASHADVAVNQQNGYLYFAYISNGTGSNNVYLRRSTDGGASFDSPVTVNNVNGSEYESVDNGVSYSIHVAVANGGAVYVVWEDNRTDASHPDIFLAKSTDGGQTFGANIRVNPRQSGAGHSTPWVTVDKSGVVYVAYTEVYFTEDLFLTKSYDGGLTFNTPARVNDDNGNWYRGKKEVAVSNDGKIHVVWTDGRNWDATGWDIYFATSVDGGLSFGTNVRVNDDNTTGNQGFPWSRSGQGTPSLAIDSQGGIHIVWEDLRNEQFVPDWTTPEYIRDIYYASSNDGGKQFSRNVKVNYYPGATIVDCADPNIAVDSNDNLHIVFSDTPYDYNDTTVYYVSSAPMLSFKTKTVVGQGCNLSFNVTLSNTGYTNETFDVTELINTTVMGTEANIKVANGTLITLQFMLNTTGFAYGNYAINILAGNASATNSIVITIPGDVNGDFKVNLPDLVLSAQAYGSKPGNPNWNPNADIDGNGVVGLSDLAILAHHYGQHYP